MISSKRNGNGNDSKSIDNVIRLLLRKNGADLHEMLEVGPKQAAMATLKIVERRGFRTHQLKVAGELTRYFARKKVSTTSAKKKQK
jgi:hypothetical protein